MSHCYTLRCTDAFDKNRTEDEMVEYINKIVNEDPYLTAAARGKLTKAVNKAMTRIMPLMMERELLETKLKEAMDRKAALA